MAFGLEFQKGVKQGIPLGLRSFLQSERLGVDSDKELEEQRKRLIKKNTEVTAKANILGLETEQGDEGLKVNVPAGYEFDPSSITTAQRFNVFPETSRIFRETLKQIEKQNQPPKYTGQKSEMDADPNSETFQQGIVRGFDESGNRVTTGIDRNYRFKETGRTVISGVIDIDGEKIGRKGRNTLLTTYENSTFSTVDKGDIKRVDNKTTDDILFESQLADYGVAKSKITNRYNAYIQKSRDRIGFRDERAMDEFRQGINNEFNRVAWDYAKLGSIEAQNFIRDIVTEGQVTINTQMGGVNNVNRQLFYDQKIQEVTDKYKGGEWGYRDFTAIVQFLEAKYKRYIRSENPTEDASELKFDLSEFE